MQFQHEQAVDVAAELGRHQAARLRPQLRDLAGDDRTQPNLAQLDIRAPRPASRNRRSARPSRPASATGSTGRVHCRPHRRSRHGHARRWRRRARGGDRRSRCANRAAGAASAPAPRRTHARAGGTRRATARRASHAPRTRMAPARRARPRRRRDRTRAGTRTGVARAGSHERSYARGGSSPAWHPGHQYAIRLSSPCPHERIRPPQRLHGRPTRR